MTRFSWNEETRDYEPIPHGIDIAFLLNEVLRSDSFLRVTEIISLYRQKRGVSPGRINPEIITNRDYDTMLDILIDLYDEDQKVITADGGSSWRRLYAREVKELKARERRQARSDPLPDQDPETLLETLPEAKSKTKPGKPEKSAFTPPPHPTPWSNQGDINRFLSSTGILGELDVVYPLHIDAMAQLTLGTERYRYQAAFRTGWARPPIIGANGYALFDSSHGLNRRGCNNTKKGIEEC